MKLNAVGSGLEKRARLGFSLAIALIVLLAVAKVILFDTLDPDCFWHLRVAEQLKADGIGPIVDRLSFASVLTPWTPYSWLAELGMRWIWDHAGWQGAVMTQACLQGAFVIMLAMACRERSLSMAKPPTSGYSGRSVDESASASAMSALVGTLFGTFLSLPYLSFRPVTASLALLACCAWIIIRDRRFAERSAAIWWLIPLTALMVNLHLYAIFVPIWMATLLVGAIWERRALMSPVDRLDANRRIERYVILTLLTLFACALTPMLPGVIGVVVHYQFSDVMVRGTVISEMQPFYSGTAGRIAAGFVLAFLLCVTFNHRRLRCGEVLWLLASGLFLFRLGRFAPVFAIAAAPIATASLPSLSDRLLSRPAIRFGMAIVLCLGTARVIWSLPAKGESLSAWLNRHGPDTPGYPCNAADYVEAQVKPTTGRLINEFSWGGYLEWRLGDKYQTLLDGRTQLFVPELWKSTYLGKLDERREFFSHLSADAAVLPIHNSAFHDSLSQLGWTTAFKDDRSEVMLPPRQAEKKPNAWPSASIFFGE